MFSEKYQVKKVFDHKFFSFSKNYSYLGLLDMHLNCYVVLVKLVLIYQYMLLM